MMTEWFKRARQTRTPVKDEQTQAKNRRKGVFATYRSMAAVQIVAQLMIWVTFFCYDRLTRTTWQAAILLVLPLALLWAAWNAGHRGIYTRAGSWVLLLLVPCLLVDATMILYALAGLMRELLSFYPHSIFVVVIALMCYATVLLGRENGVAYGVHSLRLILLGLFALATVLLNANSRVDRLWPLLGDGFGQTALTALSGVGGVWGIALLFFLPLSKEAKRDAELAKTHSDGVKRPMTAVWTLGVWALGVIWALWYALVHPWSAGDVLSTGERMMGMARLSASILVCQLTSVMWMLVLFIALCGSVVCGEKLLKNAFPKLSRPLAGGLLLLAPTIATLFWPQAAVGALSVALPYRAVLSLVAAVIMIIISRKGARA